MTSLFTRRQPSVRTSRQPCPWLGFSSRSVSRAPTTSWSGSWARAVLPAREQLQAEVTLTDWAVSLVTFLSGGSGQDKSPPGYGYSSPGMKKCIRRLKDPGTFISPLLVPFSLPLGLSLQGSTGSKVQLRVLCLMEAPCQAHGAHR